MSFRKCSFLVEQQNKEQLKMTDQSFYFLSNKHIPGPGTGLTESKDWEWGNELGAVENLPRIHVAFNRFLTRVLAILEVEASFGLLLTYAFASGKGCCENIGTRIENR